MLDKGFTRFGTKEIAQQQEDLKKAVLKEHALNDNQNEVTKQ